MPKGQAEFRMSDKKVALLEAYEEAGIQGEVNQQLERECVKFRTRRKGNVKLHVYPIKLEKLLGDWPEMRFRKRQLIAADQAIRLVRKKALQSCIKIMAARVLAHAKKSFN